MALECFVSNLADDAEFASFSCWNGSSNTPWIEEAENYVRGSVLRRSQHVLAFREGSQLVAVSAFDSGVVALPLAEPVESLIWHLRVVAIATSHQGMGLSREVFTETYRTMRQLGAEREAVTAHAHKDHGVSLRACKSVGLEPLQPIDADYWLLYGPLLILD